LIVDREIGLSWLTRFYLSMDIPGYDRAHPHAAMRRSFRIPHHP
jgi:hypothetical protein